MTPHDLGATTADGDENNDPGTRGPSGRGGCICVSWGPVCGQHASGECGVRRRAGERQEQDEGDEQRSADGADAGLTQGVNGMKRKVMTPYRSIHVQRSTCTKLIQTKPPTMRNSRVAVTATPVTRMVKQATLQTSTAAR